ncbi:Serpentine Receptor, class U [Caenorhabditis elegans]|uniref:Serpentine Receptor, class U n=1 Tax=Caenorhabditis elegans TaxID=6239 RepID=Q18375_CAEEL|nr:Serpentine Receptor, class U [Caenorhabditis elegans]CAA92285.1 Serpentine Receptor, class U [Caenorhabditis elegans]|eukprot:NP_501518.1 Serpentine Receptor, class U [Caenorhabditis elegans]
MQGSIHGLQEYKNFHYYFTFSTVIAAIPLSYMPPTIFVMFKIVLTYWKSKNVSMDRHIFTFISINFFCSLSFFFSDYFRITLPATGIFTSWCASVRPNHFFKLIFISTYIFNYCILMLPFYISLIRVVILLRPRDYDIICPKLMFILIPLLIIIPLGCTAFLIPAVGYCRILNYPLKFGAIAIYYSGGWPGWRNSYIHLMMSIIMCFLTLLCTALMFFKLRATSLNSNISMKTKKSSSKAERSLTITIIAAMIPFSNNTAWAIVYLSFPKYGDYFTFTRPIGNDIETCVTPWILYLTHPMFMSEKKNANSTSTISVINAQTQI